MQTIIRHDTLPDAPLPQAIRTHNFIPEWRLIPEAFRLARALPQLTQMPKGSGRVIVIPGWKSPQISMEPIRLFLKRLGYAAEHWGLGINHGNPERDCELLQAKLEQSFETDKRPIALVGWSLGGVIAREMARHLPEHVFGVVTYGSPVIGGPSYTIGSMYYPESECIRAQKLVQDLDQKLPIQVPLTSIFSKKDQFVHWPACIDRTSRNVTHFEVSSPHITMGLNPAVWATMARQLYCYHKSFSTAAAHVTTTPATTSDAAQTLGFANRKEICTT